ncbi:hypothetical protein AMECASPLE_029648 [Ameca splendens]|uniref:Uncharacterized protein n=1 Tax=Ameca splendens TaxID=208324 RepID=A0ABV1A185_9TELE
MGRGEGFYLSLSPRRVCALVSVNDGQKSGLSTSTLGQWTVCVCRRACVCANCLKLNTKMTQRQLSLGQVSPK